AILSHPVNYESPQPVRIHPTEPFFNYAPTQAGAFSITHQQPMEWKYRFITYDGAHDSKLLEALWQDFASPLSVRMIRTYSP
ncbi:MAG: PmoA family protein, partial [Bacteroidetes bacterium]|nr:PmoA family protein [Bacteroidota bacterium]